MISPTSPPPLAQVTSVVKHAAPQLTELGHIIQLISHYVDPAPTIALAQAAASGSLRLLDRVTYWMHATLVDPPLVEYWFACALDAAIRKNDLGMVHKIHSLHPEPLVVNSLEFALAHGTLEMVQWVVQHRHDRLCCPAGIQNLCRSCLKIALRSIGTQDQCRVTQWFIQQGAILFKEEDELTRNGSALAFMVRNGELLRWLFEVGHLSHTAINPILALAIKSAQSSDTLDAVRYLVGIGGSLDLDTLCRALVDCSCQPQNKDLVAFVLASRLCDPLRGQFVYAATRPGSTKVLQWSPVLMATLSAVSVYSVMDCASRNYHFDTIRWLVEERDDHCHVPRPGFIWPVDKLQLMALYKWMHDANVETTWSSFEMDMAARLGFLDVVQWLHTHRQEGCTTRAMDWAAGHGHLSVVQWLHANRSEGCTPAAMDSAAVNGHLSVVQWLYENRQSDSNTTAAMATAAVGGKLEVLVWLHENGIGSHCCTACALQAALRTTLHAPPIRNGLEWLRVRVMTEPPVCRGDCLPPHTPQLFWNLLGSVMASGDHQLLTYCDTYHREAFADADLGLVTLDIYARGHLPLMQWLHGRYQELRDMAWDFDASDASRQDYAARGMRAWLTHSHSLTPRQRPTMSSPSFLPALAQVDGVVKHAAPQLIERGHLIHLISHYVDPTPMISLAQAAASGSLRLLDRVAFWIRERAHLEPTLIEYSFACALDAAIHKNDLAMVQKIHSLHPEPLVVYSLQSALAVL